VISAIIADLEEVFGPAAKFAKCELLLKLGRVVLKRGAKQRARPAWLNRSSDWRIGSVPLLDGLFHYPSHDRLLSWRCGIVECGKFFFRWRRIRLFKSSRGFSTVASRDVASRTIASAPLAARSSGVPFFDRRGMRCRSMTGLAFAARSSGVPFFELRGRLAARRFAARPAAVFGYSTIMN
jgi:hypothetical protein